MYHEIADRHQSTSRLAVSRRDWADQLRLLHEQRYQAVTTFDLAESLSGDSGFPERVVSLTFDDGYADFYHAALPLLAEYGFRATVFVTTGWVAGGCRTAGKEPPGPMMSWSQLRDAADSGIEIASHSHSHPQLDRVSATRLGEELRVSKEQIEDRLGIPVRGVAYPFGYFNAKVKEATREAGYDYGCAVTNSLIDCDFDLFALPRLTVRRSTGIDAFAKMASAGNVRGVLFKDRMMSRGWAAVRRSQAAARSLSRV